MNTVDGPELPPVVHIIMTPERLSELQALADAATPGRWLWQSTGLLGADIGTSGSPEKWLAHVANEDAHDNARFITAARTAVPELVAEVERLQVLLADREAEVERLLVELSDAQGLVRAMEICPTEI